MNNRFNNLNIARKALIQDMRSIAQLHTAIQQFMEQPSKATLDVLSRKLHGMDVVRQKSKESVIQLTQDIVRQMNGD